MRVTYQVSPVSTIKHLENRRARILRILAERRGSQASRNSIKMGIKLIDWQCEVSEPRTRFAAALGRTKVAWSKRSERFFIDTPDRTRYEPYQTAGILSISAAHYRHSRFIFIPSIFILRGSPFPLPVPTHPATSSRCATLKPGHTHSLSPFRPDDPSHAQPYVPSYTHTRFPSASLSLRVLHSTRELSRVPNTNHFTNYEYACLSESNFST